MLDLIGAGARVGTCDMDALMLEELQEQVKLGGAKVWTSVANVSQEADVERLFSDFVAEHGGIDVLVNNAGITRDALLVKVKDGQVERMSLQNWQQVIDVNLTGVFLCAREGATHMVQQGNGGVIISMSSINRAGAFGQTNYSATKAGVAAMTATWAKELSKYGIRVAAVAPGYVATEMTEAIRDDIRERIIKQIPLGRMGSMEEISQAVRFIIENDFMSGRVLEIDGAQRV